MRPGFSVSEQYLSTMTQKEKENTKYLVPNGYDHPQRMKWMMKQKYQIPLTLDILHFQQLVDFELIEVP